MLAFVRRASPRASLALTSTRLLLALFTPAIAYTGMRMMDAIVERSGPGAVWWILIELGLMIAVAVLTVLQQDAAQALRGPLALELTTALAERMAEADPAELESPSERDRIVRARATAETHAGGFVDEALTVLQGTLSLILCAAILATFSPWACLLVAAAVPGALAERWCSRHLYRLRLRLSSDRRRFEHLEGALLSTTWATENKFLDAGPRLLGKLRQIGTRSSSAERALWRRSFAVVALTQLLPALTFYGFYAFLAVGAATGRLSFGALTLCLVSYHNAQRFFQSALLAGRNAHECWLHVDELLGWLDAPKRERPRSRHALPVAARGLRLEDVGFRHAGAEAWAVRHIDLTIEPGELVGIVGGNGSGKTTLLKLMTGVYRPTEGRVLLDGVALEDWDSDALQRRFAVVFQEFARYRMSLRDNVAPGAAPAGDEQLAPAFRDSGVDTVVADLPRGADTELSRAYGDGVELSGGQWQKVALARALYRREAQLLLLDEPTSALDEVSERRVFQHLAAQRGLKTVVLITHRLSALCMADRILVLERGRLVRAVAGASDVDLAHA